MNSKKSPCPYGEKCYRINPEHLEQYDHPKRTKTNDRNSTKILTDKKTKNPLITNYFKRTKPNESGELDDEQKKIIVNDHLKSPKTLCISKKSLDHDLIRNLHQKLFLIPIPDEIFLFWNFCQQISSKQPEDAFIDALGIKLVGPFDLLNNKLNESHVGNENILTHWRYFYDPPEFQTFAIIDTNCRNNHLKLESISCDYHLGYFRDDPTDQKPLVVSNDSKKSCEIHAEGDNIFATFYTLLSGKRFKLKNYNDQYNNLRRKLETFAEENQINLIDKTKHEERKKKVNAPTLHQFGIVVPMSDNNVGYRKLPITDNNLKRSFERIINLNDDEQRRKCSSVKEIQHMITLIQYANDEKDFGMGLEFGIDLFDAGHQFFHRSSKHLLKQAYELLDRKNFAQIIHIHLSDDNRQKQWPNLSAI